MNRMRAILTIWAVLLAAGAEISFGGDTGLSDPARQPSAPAGAKGYPSRAADLDALPGFQNPPPGYGEVPFWWWTGDALDVDRMIWQVRELHKKGISGVQVNYSHFDTPGWLTEQDKPGIFTKDWWDVYRRISQECSKLDMGIGLSTYTLDWPRGAKNLFYQLFYSKPELNAMQLETGGRLRLRGGETKTAACPDDTFAARAYRIKSGKVERGGVDLTALMRDGKITWTAPEDDWEIWTFQAVPKAGSLNPLMDGAGDTVIRDYYQQFQNRNPGKTSQGLNYFFNDELHIGLDKFAWNPDFPEEFRRRKGYELLDVLPGMWVDIGSITPKVRMDYADVRMSMMEERYFQPIYAWHAARGMIFACDSGGRGRRPNEFGDYFRATRWYTAPGHDTPGGRADPIKGKVSSSIANLYQRPRVWLEGYHSLGWGAKPEQLMFATRENYLYGCTLLNLHGLYYTTYGSHWEWAPPCYHFRMPYWAHMDKFLGYFDRLSYLMSQGHHVCDVAVIYPVAPYEAELNGRQATDTAFDLGQRLMTAGINFEFIDNDSLARAEVENGRLVVRAAGASYQALVFPNMEAVRWESIEKAASFALAGGTVLSVGSLPSASDRAGREDPELAVMNDQAFRSDCRLSQTGQGVKLIGNAFVQDVRGIGRTVRALHRKIGPRDVYLVMDAEPGTVVEFRARGAVELWDPWTGEVHPLPVVERTATGTQVELPLEAYEAQIVVFTPGKEHVNPPKPDARPMRQKTLPSEWSVSFVSTMDNNYGDFRIPVTPENKRIGVEARRFAWTRETPELTKTAMLPSTDDRSWDRVLHGFGPQFYVLGPVPDNVDTPKLEVDLAKLKRVDPSTPLEIAGKSFFWKPYDFSWRYGKEGDPGHQGYHGLKRTVTDDFICLGEKARGLNETRYTDSKAGRRRYLWTSVTAAERHSAMIHVSRDTPADKSHTSPVITPAVVYVNGDRVSDLAQPISLNAGANPTLVRYDHAGRGHFVMRRQDRPVPETREPLAMRWHNDAGLIPFDVYAGNRAAEWFRFRSSPGTSAICVQAFGEVQAWLDGEPLVNKGDGRFEAAKPSAKAAIVALRVEPHTGYSGGAVIPEPVMIETGVGVMSLGDWSQMGILNNYSGGVRYQTIIALTEEQTRGTVQLDLGSVAATAEVHINGKKTGVRVAPPWRLDVTGFLKSGENTLEVLVYNTLSNHYQTIPSRYRGSPVSGLLGPARLLSRDWKTGELYRPEESAIPSGKTVLKSRRTVSTVGHITIATCGGSLENFDRTVAASGNLLRQPGLIKSISGSQGHSGGGSDFSALFNGTVGNGQGGEGTENDGRTFVGMAEENTLDIVFDPAKPPKGVPIYVIRTYAGHHDSRASQKYTVYAAKAATPDQFVKIADVNCDIQDGLNEVAISPVKKQPLVEGAGRLRFVFHNNSLGFSVYREIAVFGTPTTAPDKIQDRHTDRKNCLKSPAFRGRELSPSITTRYREQRNQPTVWAVAVAASGNASHMRPSKCLPAFFLFTPPHCLKKNGT